MVFGWVDVGVDAVTLHVRCVCGGGGFFFK